MTKTPVINFRCPPALRTAIDADAAKSGQSVSEIVLRALCKRYKIEYTPPATGRPKKREALK